MNTDWPGGFTGVPVYSNGPDSGYGTGCQNAAVGPSGHAVVTGIEWQCVELVNRLYVTKGWINATWPGDGDTMWLHPPKGLKTQAQHEITSLMPGDVVSIEVQPPPLNGTLPLEQAGGHVLIVSDVRGSTITFVSQNAGDTPAGVVTYGTLSGGTLSVEPSGQWTYPVDGVVDAPVSSTTPTPSTHQVPFTRFCTTLGCKLMNGPKSKPGNPYYGQPLPFTPHVSTYIDWGGCSQCGSSDLPHTYNFSRPNTCRDLTLAMVMGDGADSYNPDYRLTVVLSEQGARPQAVRLVFHKVVTKMFSLTGSAFQVHLEVASGLENFYLISGEATGCSTPSGAGTS
jgi:hypothetical protein